MRVADKRRAPRMPLQLFVNEYDGQEERRCLALNVSPGGLFLNRLATPEVRPPRDRVIGLEFELPGTAETVWAAGLVCFESVDEYFRQTGVRFTGIARFHQSLIDDVVAEYRMRRLRQLLAAVRRNRRN